MAAALEVVSSNNKDPKELLWEYAKPLADNVNVFGDDALIAIYERARFGQVKTKGGLILADQTTAEDEYQGKVGLLMKVGPLFYCKGERDDSNAAFFGNNQPKVGDWVLFRVGDTYSMKIKDQMFRMCEAKMLRGSLIKPDMIW